MKSPHRSALLAAGFIAVLVAPLAPSVAGAQRNQQPGPDTKRALVTTFRGDPNAGIRVADEIRDRIQSEFNIRTLMPNPKKDIDKALEGSGYKPDSALSPNDIKELAKIIRGDEVIDGTVQKLPTGAFRIVVRMFLARDVGHSQPLGSYDVTNLGDVAKPIVDEYDRARKQLPETQNCENGIRANTPVPAIAAARKAIAEYPKAVIARLCLAGAYELYKNTADSTGPWKDSVIAITTKILELDKTSKIALTMRYGAYKFKADTTNAIETLIGLLDADPTNTTLREQVIAELVNSGRADRAVEIAKRLVADNPGIPDFARSYWVVLRTAKRYKEAVPAGIAYASIDTALADTSYFFRQIQDLVTDSAYVKAAEMAAAATAKFPTRTDFLLTKSQNERRAGQLPSAKASLERALAVDPKVPNANYLLAQIVVEMGATDDAIKYAKADAAADAANKQRAAAVVLTVGNATYKAGDATKKPEDYKKAIPILQLSDSLAASPQAAFLIAVSAYQAMASNLEVLKVSKSCDDFKAANDFLTLVSMYMPRGGPVSPENAKAIMGGAMQFQPFVDTSMKKYCK